VAEHDLDIVAAADCVIDLGPDGGESGGQVVAWGTPQEVAREPASRTGAYLARHLRCPQQIRRSAAAGLSPVEVAAGLGTQPPPAFMRPLSWVETSPAMSTRGHQQGKFLACGVLAFRMLAS
jgi:hypothetical protein